MEDKDYGGIVAIEKLDVFVLLCYGTVISLHLTQNVSGAFGW